MMVAMQSCDLSQRLKQYSMKGDLLHLNIKCVVRMSEG